MKTFWGVVILGVVAVTAVPGCKRREPEPIPGPKSGTHLAGHAHAPGIAWFQGSIDEAFARPKLRRDLPPGMNCPGMRVPAPPHATS